MYEVVEAPGSLRFRVSSEPECIAAVLREVRNHCRSCTAEDSAKVYVILRELLNNALVHGNRQDPGRHIRCELAASGTAAVRICVEDEGDGFDHQTLNYSLPPVASRETMRGYPLIHALTSSLRFNERGNRVEAEFCWSVESTFLLSCPAPY